MGGLQALSRSTYSKLIPKTEDTTSFFSFYGVTEKIGIVFGMLFYAVAAQVTGTVRFSVIIFMFFFFSPWQVYFQYITLKLPCKDIHGVIHIVFT